MLRVLGSDIAGFVTWCDLVSLHEFLQYLEFLAVLREPKLGFLG